MCIRDRPSSGAASRLGAHLPITMRPAPNDRLTVQEVTVPADKADDRHLLRRAAGVAAAVALGLGSVSSALATQPTPPSDQAIQSAKAVSYTHLRAHETVLDLVCRLLLEKK